MLLILTHRGWAHRQRVSTTFLTQENSQKRFLCSWWCSNLGPLDLESLCSTNWATPSHQSIHPLPYVMGSSAHPCHRHSCVDRHSDQCVRCTVLTDRWTGRHGNSLHTPTGKWCKTEQADKHTLTFPGSYSWAFLLKIMWTERQNLRYPIIIPCLLCQIAADLTLPEWHWCIW